MSEKRKFQTAFTTDVLLTCSCVVNGEQIIIPILTTDYLLANKVKTCYKNQCQSAFKGHLNVKYEIIISLWIKDENKR